MLRIATLLLLCVCAAGCVGTRRIEQRQVPADQHAMLDARSQYLKAHMGDGSLLILRNWLPIGESRLSGR